MKLAKKGTCIAYIENIAKQGYYSSLNYEYMVQLEGNLIHARDCVCRITLVAIRTPAKLNAGTCIHREANK